MKYFIIIASIIFFASCGNHDTRNNPKNTIIDSSLITKKAPQISFNILNVYPHDPTSYTEGLEIFNGKVYESAGDYTNSRLQISDLKTGKVEQSHKIGKTPADSTFGEGITIFKGKIYQLTWREHIVFVYDQNNINKVIKTFNWPYEGWGMTHNDTSLVISDGSANIYFVDPENFKIKSRITVNEDGVPVDSINELEWVDGFIYSNRFTHNDIFKINPANGNIVGKMDFTGIIEKNAPGFLSDGNNVINGIAYDSSTKKFYITGKHWPKLFEVSLN